jgi:hypothetical protein
MNKLFRVTLASSVVMAAASTMAAPVTPTFDTFGTLAGATFGGSGIPNTAVAITNLSGVTLGLTATQRYAQPAVTNNGAGVFHAVNGAYSAGDNLARWNFDYYVGGTNVSAYTYKLLADFDPVANNDESTYTDISAYLTQSLQGSENLGFGTDFSQFDPNRAGQYGFVLAAYDSSGAEVGRSAILVNVPEPASLALVGVALLGAGMARRRKA